MAHDSSQPTCPRCGYDLRGIATTWDGRGECDLQSVCAECGLAFEWADLLAPLRQPPAWCFEYCPRGHFHHAAAATAARSLLPWLLWQRLRMEHRVRPGRLAGYAAIAFLLPLLLLYASVQTAQAIYVRSQTQALLLQVQQSLTQRLAALQASAATDPEAAKETQPTIDQIQIALSMPTAVNHSYGAAIVEAVFFPARSVSKGNTSSVFGVTPYPAPRELYSRADEYLMYSLPPGVSYPRWVAQQEPRGPFVMLAAGIAVFLLIPLSMALLPISRRRSRVRWEHVARVAAYSAPLPIVIAFIALALMGSALIAPAYAGRAIGLGMFIAYFTLPIAAFFWWWIAIKCYFRMPRSLLVALVVTSTCTLAVGVALFYLDMDLYVQALR